VRRLLGRSTFSGFAAFTGGLDGGSFEASALPGSVFGGSTFVPLAVVVAVGADDPHATRSEKEAIHREFIRAI
jgi:hypothetical protein